MNIGSLFNTKGMASVHFIVTGWGGGGGGGGGGEGREGGRPWGRESIPMGGVSRNQALLICLERTWEFLRGRWP